MRESDCRGAVIGGRDLVHRAVRHRTAACVSGPSLLTPRFVRGNLPLVETYETVLDALGDQTRRQIVDQLRRGPSSVGELAARLPVSRPAVSQHLMVLRRSGLVSYSERGTRNIYRLDQAGLNGLRAWLDTFWQTALVSYADAVRSDNAGGAAQDRHEHKEHPDA